MTAIRGLKIGLVTVPLLVLGYKGFQEEGVKGVARKLVSAYVPLDIDTGQFTTQNIGYGYGPPIAAKVASALWRWAGIR